jgi:GrpB-like predicted nucleotidyltransferase (UPF0157 family)/2'-5' RNA ligase
LVRKHRDSLDVAACWGVPAHVTVLYPFVEPAQVDEGLITALAAAIEPVRAFELQFARTAWFGEEVLWLDPEPAQPFRDLTTAVWRAFPHQPPYAGAHDDVVPHLTIAERRRGTVTAMREAEQAIQQGLPLAARVEHVLLIAGTPAPHSWRIIHEFPLLTHSWGSGSGIPPTPENQGHAQVSDEELQKITVGKRTPHNAPITLAAYDPQWPGLFVREANRIRAVLGDTAVVIEHVGSTSVPGLAAKPIIDMLLVVPNSADESSYVPLLQAAGYVLRIREPEFEHRLLKGPDTDINLHVFTLGCSEIDRMLRFRDWLRINEADRNHYERTKRDLTQRVWRHVQHYADAKTTIIQKIMHRADTAE